MKPIALTPADLPSEAAQAGWRRGLEDAMSDRPPIFRQQRAGGIVPTSDDPMADDWSGEARMAYIIGYDAGRR